jgi:hypothetical protein
MSGTSYGISLGLITEMGSAPPARLQAEILVATGSAERQVAVATFDVSDKYERKTASVVGVDAQAHAGDVITLRVTRLSGQPCVYFAGDGSDHYLEVPQTTVK